MSCLPSMRGCLQGALIDGRRWTHPDHGCRWLEDGPKTHVFPPLSRPLPVANLMPHLPYTPSQEARHLGG
jgi:hypothetical protein